MDYKNFLSNICFRFIHPETPPCPMGCTYCLGEMVDGPGCFSSRRLRLISLIQIFLVKNGKCKAVYVTFARFRECLRLLSEPSLIWESGRCQMTRLLLTWVFGTALRFWLE